MSLKRLFGMNRNLGKNVTAMGMAVALALLACSGQKFNKIEPAKVDATQKAAAETYGSDTLKAWAKDSYPKIPVPASPEFQAAQGDATKQAAADKALEAQLGDFKSMTFYEAQASEPANMVIYRFKATFSKSGAPAEVRVVYNTKGELAGFWIKPWKDKLG